MGFSNFVDKLRRYFWFQKDELRGFLITVFILAFVFSFTEWGVDVFDWRVGFFNLLSSLFIVGVSVFIHHSVQRLVALYYGFRAEHILWWPGLTFSAILVFFTNGMVKFLPGSALMIHHLPVHRLGFFRYGPNFSTFAAIASVGPVANLVVAGVFRFFAVVFDVGAGFVSNFYYFNLLFAVFNLLPFPPLDGSRIFYASRLMYVFVFASVVSYVFFALVVGVYSYFLAVIFGVVCWFLFYHFFEKGWA